MQYLEEIDDERDVIRSFGWHYSRPNGKPFAIRLQVEHPIQATCFRMPSCQSYGVPA